MASGPMVACSTLSACTAKKYRCSRSPGGGAAPTYPATPSSPRRWNPPRGSLAASGDPAPRASVVVVTGRSTTTQCHQPDGPGASGSNTLTRNERVCGGKPSQCRCGDTFARGGAACASGRRSPSRTSSLVSVNDGTTGSSAYGSGASGRVRDTTTGISSVRGGRCGRLPPSCRAGLARALRRRGARIARRAVSASGGMIEHVFQSSDDRERGRRERGRSREWRGRGDVGGGDGGGDGGGGRGCGGDAGGARCPCACHPRTRGAADRGAEPASACARGPRAHG